MYARRHYEMYRLLVPNLGLQWYEQRASLEERQHYRKHNLAAPAGKAKVEREWGAIVRGSETRLRRLTIHSPNLALCRNERRSAHICRYGTRRSVATRSRAIGTAATATSARSMRSPP